MHTLSRLRVHRRARRVAPLAFFGLISLLAVTACGSGVGGGHPPAAATVNGTQISQSALNDELNAIAANPAYTAAITQSGTPVTGPSKGTFDLAFSDKVLSRQILLQVIHEEIVRRHIVITPAQIQTSADSQKTQMGNDAQGLPLWNGFSASYQNLLATRAAEVDALQNAIAPVDDAAVQKYYDANKAKLVSNCLSHILVASQAQAQDIHNQLVAGADFATLAKKYSTDTGSASKGGDLGCAPPGTYVAEFEAAVATLSPGQLSGVVHSQFGYHIIKMTAKKTSLNDVRSQIVTALQTQGATQLSNFVQAQVGKATISVNPAYGTFDKSTGQVTPPTAPPASAGGGSATTTSLPAGAAPSAGQNQAPPTSGP